MNFLLFERSNILNIFILLLLIGYSFYYTKGRSGNKTVFQLFFTALFHVVFCMITEITVNSPEVSTKTNDVLHFFLYFFALMFGVKYFEYVLSFILMKKKQFKYKICVYVLAIIGMIVYVIKLPYYAYGFGTNYSTGIGLFVGYGLFFFMMVSSNVLLFIFRKRIDNYILYSVLPISALSIAIVSVQAIIPEFLFTGSAVTLIAIAIFFTVENPVRKVQERAYIDYCTGVYNRNCYENDCRVLSEKKKKKNLGVVICDLNYLKFINDTYGHLEGDRQISMAAEVLQQHMKDAYKVYRTGGDEFVVLYMGDKVSFIEAEMDEVRESCKEKNQTTKVPLEMAMGYALMNEGETLEQVVKRADEMMYANKKELKKKSNIPSR
ncbi:MAG: GGDEF domain-containing protein [Lachnospiraceae bacterium]